MAKNLKVLMLFFYIWKEYKLIDYKVAINFSNLKCE